jgi:Zn-dependent protease with chaperone function
MSFAWRLVVVSLAAFAVTGLIASVVVAVLSVRGQSLPARLRSRRLARLRLLPAVSGVMAGLTAMTAFLVFESRKPRESVSDIIIGFAVFGAMLMVASVWRAWRLGVATRRITASLTADAEPIALDGIDAPALAVVTTFPIVAVVGLFKPTLIIARSVLSACSADELRAVLAHEQGHMNRHDNLSRLAMTAAPDVLAWLPISARIFAAWCEASEEAADDESARGQAEDRMHLASALIKVARLAAAAPPPPVVPAAALYTGHHLDTRVRRLLRPPTAVVPSRIDALALGALVAMLAIVIATQMPAVHEIIETVLHALP